MSPNRARASSSRHVRQSPCGSDDKHATQEAVVLPVRSDPLAALLVPRHVQTEDYEETHSEYILGREYNRFFFKTHLFRATARVAHDHEMAGIKSRRRVQNIKIMPLSYVPSVGINSLLFHCRRDKYLILKLLYKCKN